ncbi:sarcosine oxidase subunit alpha family protein [Mesorhizobium captivum]|uniref:sarcosine oxidase subunit alpha family protein n=1 Tax=Mesorhizobium captivum TaxID=3072319 RepID=UPI002A24DD78|nr:MULTISPECIES: sarcosine oxidase subunit alpha family protein [unclassified Mesorhizobium]MDX8449147.1 sarcosine oxidase subunit alpha family protein [Mesorhizobium sp. VK3C]MDX8514638.1 sarcosine oxidase subunit alpha family protein [Mesorhizobium sp. VK23E]
MMMELNTPGTVVDTSRPLLFKFNGRAYRAYSGDTVASALLRNRVQLVARSFKYHRPRGVLDAGSAEPNCWVQIGEGGREDTNMAATTVEVYDGMEVRSLNSWPNPNFDISAVNNFLSPLFPAGFYYKTFMSPRRLWPVYERFIRKMAGVGRIPRAEDPDAYEYLNTHVDTLVVGAGPAGLSAALEAGRGGSDVLLIDDQPQVGGALLDSPQMVDGMPGHEWVQKTFAELAKMDNVTILTRCTVFGHYEHGYFAALERIEDHLPVGSRKGLRQRLWHIRATQAVFATGAHERPLIFENNDTPGVLLASAACTFVHRYGVRTAQAAVVFTNNDSAYYAAKCLADCGVSIQAIVDTRNEVGSGPKNLASNIGARLLVGSAVVKGCGKTSIRAALIARHGSTKTERISCDMIAVSGGWNPVVHLHSQQGGVIKYDDRLACFVPVFGHSYYTNVGSANGVFSVEDCIQDAKYQAGAIGESRRGSECQIDDAGHPRSVTNAIEAFWFPHKVARPSKCFVDYFGDVTVRDIQLASQEGYRSVEHMKRYTTAGMGIDQGKTGNMNALALLGMASGRTVSEVGTTTYRPPYRPVTFGALAGYRRDDLVKPTRRTSVHQACHESGAIFDYFGQWQRPTHFKQNGEDLADAALAEAKNVRSNVGITDVSTLGKIYFKGRDVAEFLNKVYTNRWDNLKPGRCRYGVMLGDDGMVLDDGVTARLTEFEFHMTTTSGGAAGVYKHLDDLHKSLWPDLKFKMASVTTQWASVVVTGPRSRELLSRVIDRDTFNREELRHFQVTDVNVSGIAARIFGISFTGELSFEVNVPARFGQSLWRILMKAGEELSAKPFGMEALSWLRAEKGHFIVGRETDGTVTPYDLGLGWMVNMEKGEFIGRRALLMEEVRREGRLQLIGLAPADGRTLIPEGAQLIDRSRQETVMVGHVTSSIPKLSSATPFSLALLKNGRSRIGEAVTAWSEGREYPAVVVGSQLYDKHNERLKA